MYFAVWKKRNGVLHKIEINMGLKLHQISISSEKMLIKLYWVENKQHLKRASVKHFQCVRSILLCDFVYDSKGSMIKDGWILYLDHV